MNLSPRENWRIFLMILLLVVSAVAIFAPLGATGGGSDGPSASPGGPTNLQYGLELSGGTRVRAPLVGMTAEGVNVPADQEREVSTSIASRLNLSLTDVQIRLVANGPDTVEVYADEGNGGVTRAEFAAALQAAGVDATEDDIRDGVTEATRERTVQVLNNKINQGGLTGGSASTTTTPTGETFVLVEVPNADRQEVIDLIGSEGRVQLVAHFPVQRGNETTTRDVPLLTQEDFTSISQARQAEQGQPARVPVALTGPAAENYTNAMNEFGFTSDRGVNNCGLDVDDPAANPDNFTGYCLYTVSDGRVAHAASMSPGLAELLRSGEFLKDPTFVITAGNFSEAQQLAIDLQAGALPTTLAIQEEGTTYFLEASLANEFKLFSLITAIIAVLAVAGVVFLRYREPGVAAPMVLTAGAEVFLLLGFASAVGLALDLSHIAGFIAVIGTGVDDLVIIADEILQSGEIATSRVFESRFRKAFWVIGAAAATTIIAMSPLAVLSLGDLQGFAIVTIVGVLLGVLVTRPAYGDILRNVVLDDA
jgi:preprotein translocase subunit SecD